MFTTYILTHFCQFCPTYYAAKWHHSWKLSLWNLSQILSEDEQFTGNDEDQTLEKELEDVDLKDDLFSNWEEEMQNLEEREGPICQNPLPDHVNINCIQEEIKCDEPLTEEQLNVHSCLSELKK